MLNLLILSKGDIALSFWVPNRTEGLVVCGNILVPPHQISAAILVAWLKVFQSQLDITLFPTPFLGDVIHREVPGLGWMNAVRSFGYALT